MSLSHDSSLADKLTYGDEIPRQVLIDALQQLADLLTVLEDHNLSDDPKALELELDKLTGGDDA